MVICPEQDCEWIAYMNDLDTSMVEVLGVHEEVLWSGRFKAYKDWQHQKGSKSSKQAWTWEGSSSVKWNTTSTQGSSKRGQSVPVDISKRTNPEEQGLQWRTLDEIDTSLDYLFSVSSRKEAFLAARAARAVYPMFVDHLALTRTAKIHASIVPTVT